MLPVNPDNRKDRPAVAVGHEGDIAPLRRAAAVEKS
jgi:hypothetical protein